MRVNETSCAQSTLIGKSSIYSYIYTVTLGSARVLSWRLDVQLNTHHTVELKISSKYADTKSVVREGCNDTELRAAP
jgi:hypothetical protein